MRHFAAMLCLLLISAAIQAGEGLNVRLVTGALRNLDLTTVAGIHAAGNIVGSVITADLALVEAAAVEIALFGVGAIAAAAVNLSTLAMQTREGRSSPVCIKELRRTAEVVKPASVLGQNSTAVTRQDFRGNFLACDGLQDECAGNTRTLGPCRGCVDACFNSIIIAGNNQCRGGFIDESRRALNGCLLRYETYAPQCVRDGNCVSL